MRFSTLLVGVAALFVAAGPVSVSRVVADDVDTCAAGTGDEAIAACTRAISSGRLHDRDLAAEYYNRGAKYGSRRDYDRAIADYTEAIRLDPKYAEPMGIVATLTGKNANSIALSLITTRLCGLGPARLTTSIGAMQIMPRKTMTTPSPITQSLSD